MAYPTAPRWSITLYYNNAHSFDIAKKVTLYIQHTHPDDDPELSSTTFIGGYTSSVGEWRRNYSLALEPFEFPGMMADYDALIAVLKANHYFWIEVVSGTDTYPYVIARTEVSLIGRGLNFADETAERMLTLDFKKSDL